MRAAYSSPAPGGIPRLSGETHNARNRSISQTNAFAVPVKPDRTTATGDPALVRAGRDRGLNRARDLPGNVRRLVAAQPLRYECSNDA